MLALGQEQNSLAGRRAGEVGQGRATVAWHSPSPGRPLAQDPGINIRQKISQWEGRSQESNEKEKAHRPAVTRRLSGDLLGNGACGEGWRGSGSPGKAAVSKAKSLGLDFRETPAHAGHAGPGRKSEPSPSPGGKVTTSGPVDRLTTPGRSSKVSTALVDSKPFPVSPQTRSVRPSLRDSRSGSITTSSPVKRIITTNGELKVGCILDVEVVPPSAEDHEENMPPGNFYTCRGFWRRMEGDRLFWEKGRTASADPPPKPQRTYKYQGTDNTTGANWVQWDSKTSPSKDQSDARNAAVAQPPSFPPPPCPVTNGNGFSRHKKNRKSFEYEDVVRLVSQPGKGSEARRSELYHAYSDDNIYEDIICDPYEDVKLSASCLPLGRARPWTVSQRQRPHIPKLPPKPKTLRGYTDKVERGRSHSVMSPSHTYQADDSRPITAKRPTAHKTYRLPQYVNKIHMIFDAKRGRKRVKSQGGVARDDNSGTESDPEDSSKAGSRRSIYVQSTLKRRPGYRTLERDLLQLQQQQLFQHFVVVSLRKHPPGNTYSPEITQQFPNKFEKSSRHSRQAEDRLKAIPKFCFPDARDWCPSADMPSETFSFVLTGEDGSRWFCYCRKILPSGKGKRLPEVHCIVSRLGCFNLFAKILEEVERRREISPPLVCSFMRSVMEAPFPAPGRTITVKSFLPGSGNEVLTLCRPVDSRLEHVDFDSLLQCLSVARLLQVFASLLLERRVIFIADKLSVLSRCSHAILALLYPFTWQHTFVPVLPASMLDISCSPTPFLMGALAPCLPQLLELPIEEVLIVDLGADKFVVQLNDEDCILPSKLQAALLQILEEREHMLRQEEEVQPGGQRCDLSSLVSEAFVRFFVELVGHYSLHMSKPSAPAGSPRELQRESFRKSHPSRGVRQFLQLFMDTQMFAGFIHDRELRKEEGKGLFEVRASEYLVSNPDPEPSGVNKFLKGLGSKIKFLQIK